MKKNNLFIVGGGSAASALLAASIMATAQSTKVDDVFEKPSIPITNPYVGLNDWQYTPTFNNGKSRKCSNKKYHKRKKARNGKR